MIISRRIKQLFAGISAVLVVIAVLTAFGVYRCLHKFLVEDQIHGTFSPILRALDAYEDDHGVPAASLDQLIPKYIAQIPNSALVDSVRYSLMPDGRAWQFWVHSTALFPPRIYCCRSIDNYTAEESKRVILRYHCTWVVMRD